MKASSSRVRFSARTIGFTLINSLFTGGSEFVPSPRNPDIYWMQERSTRLK